MAKNSSGNHIRHSSTGRFPFKKRCEIEGCSKRAKDCIQGIFLCRIHSPCRKGCILVVGEGNKKEDDENESSM